VLKRRAGCPADSRGRQRYENPSKNENVPDSKESWDARRTALPRSLLTNSLTASGLGGNGSNVPLAN
jgi:hypothetical protein